MSYTLCEKSVDGGYDSGYARCGCFWGTEPGSLIKRFESTKNLAGLCTLDAGCGEGKNAAYLADAGSNVDAIDISSLAITNALRLFGEKSRISWRTANIMDSVVESERYDLVIAYGLLHCLPDARAVETVVRKLQRATKIGGANLICAFNEREQQIESAHPGFHPCLLAHSEYVALYDGWSLEFSSDTDLTETHPHNNIQHTHSMTRLIARKMCL